MSTHRTERPTTSIDRARVRGLGGVRIVLARELSTKFLTKAFWLSTLLFALLSVVLPLVMGGEDDQNMRLGHTAEGASVATQVQALGGETVELVEVDDRAAGESAVTEDDVDAVLVPKGNSSPEVLVNEDLDPQLGSLLQSTLQDQALRQVALDSGASPGQVTDAERSAVLDVVTLGSSGSDGVGGLMVGLGFGIAAAVVVLLWGIPLATDVMQEKASRVVEILLSSIRPWQLLAGKVVATTVIGLTQLGVILAATWGGLALSGSAFAVDDLSFSQTLTGLACIILGIITCSTLMAGLAARVERQEDLSSALQPAMCVTLAPVAAAIYGVFEFPESGWLDALSVAPVFNTFVMPARMAVETVPAWQLIAAIVIAVATSVACFAVAGRVYSGAVLRSGGRVGLREALRSS